MNNRSFIAKRVAEGLSEGDIVNLGIGIPTMVPKYLPEGLDIIFQSENGIIGIGPAPEVSNFNVFDAGGASASVIPGGQFIDSAESFGLIRSGRVDVTVLGALQVDTEGNLANWEVPDKMLVGFGGAMDLVTCAKKVVVAMEHTAKGIPKILDKCTFPLTGKKCVDEIITELAVFKVTDEGLLLTEISNTTTIDDIKEKTNARFTISKDLKVNKVK